MRRKPSLRALGTVALALCIAASSAACTRYDRVGPIFAPSATPAEGYAIVYVYRPTKAWGAAQPYLVTHGGRSFMLHTGGYGALVVPEGPTTFFGNQKPIEVQASHAKPLYVRAQFDSLIDSWAPWKGAIWKTEQVSEAEALGDLAEIGLAPGGRGRYMDGAAGPVTSAEPAASTQASAAPSASSPPPPAEDPSVDTLYLRDGTTVAGEIIAEDGKAVSVMMKDGHGRAVTRGTIDRIVRRTKK